MRKIRELGKKTRFPEEALVRLFVEIISAARSLEEPLRIAYLGPEGTFTEMAALGYFGSSVERIPTASIEDVFRTVENGKADYGVVPIENSLEGTVNTTLDTFVDSPLKIVGETFLRIRHNLVSNETDLKKIKRVYAHPQAIAQCRRWLSVNLPNVEFVETSSTAKAASVVPLDKYSAAIASEVAAAKYDLKVIARGIEDNPLNYTRFWIIGNRETNPTGEDKTTVICSVKDKPGALYKLLEPFYEERINLTKIESRPSKRKAWDYLFFIDLEGHKSEEKVRRAINSAKEQTMFMKILGSYPRGTREWQEE